jgi:hypothetical protein
MTTANKITNVDLVARAKSLLLSQFQTKENINKVVEALVEQVQELDNTAVSLQSVRMLDNAYGVYLDNIGQKLKVDRSSLNDDDYKTAIKVRMLKNSSKGSYDDIHAIMSLLTYNLPVYIKNNHYYVIELTAYLACLNTETGLEMIKQLFPAGVALRIQNSSSTPFGFEGNPKAKGFSSTSYNTVQGQICSLIGAFYGVAEDSRFRTSEDLFVPPDTGTITPTSKPEAKGSPVITPSEDIRVSTVLNCSTGTWESLTPITYTYVWYVDGNAIAGATGSSYTALAEDVGELIYCKVTATNLNGSTDANSGSVVVSDVPPISGDVVANLGLSSYYHAHEIFLQESQVEIIFKTDGTFQASGNGFTTTTGNYLTTSGAGSAADYEIQFTNISGVSLDIPQEDTWYPLTSNVTFLMTTDYLTRDRGGEQLIRLRNKATLEVAEANVYISVQCETVVV